MPASATVTSFHTFLANTRAKASEMNTNLSNYRGHSLPIDPTLAAAANNAYDLGSSEYAWRTAYFGQTPRVNGADMRLQTFQTFTATTTAATTGGYYLGDATAGTLHLTLPYGTGATGSVTTIKKIDSTDNFINILSPTTTALLDGATTTAYICKQFRFKSFLYDGSHYRMIGSGGPVNQKSVTFTKSGASTGTATDLTAATLSLPTTGKEVEIFFAPQDTNGTCVIQMENVTATAFEVQSDWRMLCNGVPIGICEIRRYLPASGVSRDSAHSLYFRHTPAPGVQVYQLQWYHNTNPNTISFQGARMIAQEVEE